MFNPEPKSLQEKFLRDFTEKVLPQGRSDTQRWCCWLRFHPQNYNSARNVDIAEQIKEQLNNGFTKENISATLAAVVTKIKDTFGEKMAKDGVQIEQLQRERGWSPRTPEECYPWQVIYQWLWEVEFPREGWELATTLATCAIKEFKVVDIQERRRDLSFEEIPACEENIKKDQKYAFVVHLPEEGYLLLLNRGTTGKYYCLSLSVTFASISACGGMFTKSPFVYS